VTCSGKSTVSEPTETLTPASNGTTSTLRTTITGYDSGDRPTTVTTTTYAALNVAAGTEVKSLTYDDQGNPNSTSDGGSSNVANGRTLRTTYDTLGRVMSSTDATGLRTDTTYDTSGRVATTTVTDANTSSANTGAAAVTGYSARHRREGLEAGQHLRPRHR
jgi:YD repeat-containing protein